MIRKIFKTGHSLAITVSARMLKDLGLKQGDAVRMEVDSRQRRLIVSRAEKNFQMALDLHARPRLGQALPR
jgi:antitoxin component of MazEF toxin-antitoxin module